MKPPKTGRRGLRDMLAEARIKPVPLEKLTGQPEDRNVDQGEGAAAPSSSIPS